MTHRERINAAIRGEKTDRVPIALWRHFPHEDQTARGHADAVISFHKQFDFDLVKVTPTSSYPAEAWGGTFKHKDNEEGTRESIERAVQEPEDWAALAALEFKDGVLARELETLRLVREGVGPDVHVMQTIFSPLTIGKQLAGEELLAKSMKDHGDALKAGLETVAETMARYITASLKNGADSIFFATQYIGRSMATDDQYREFGVPYDMTVLDALSGSDTHVLMHLHGPDPMFELLDQYPVDMINWHDRETPPTLGEGHAKFTKGAVVGGIGREGVMLHGTPDEVTAEVRDAISQTGGERLVISTGCVTMTTTPEKNIVAARAAVEN